MNCVVIVVCEVGKLEYNLVALQDRMWNRFLDNKPWQRPGTNQQRLLISSIIIMLSCAAGQLGNITEK